LYAGPDGTGSACTEAAPCGLTTAADAAEAGDTVLVDPGGYYLGLKLTSAITIAAADDHERPAIYGMVEVSTGDVTLEGLVLRDTAIDSDAGAVRIDRCELTGNGDLLSVGGGSTSLTISNSLIHDTGVGIDVYGGSVSAVNVTVVAQHDASMSSNAQVSFSNSVLVASGGSVASGSGAATASWSNVSNTTNLTLGPGVTSGDPPIFRDAATGDFHVAAGSPTIGAGDPSTPAGGEDLDGWTRPSTPVDEGAFTYFAPPTVTITEPVAGTTYSLGQQVVASFSCSDGTGPGIASCLDPNAGFGAPDYINMSPGPNTFTVIATSLDGQKTTASVTYDSPTPPQSPDLSGPEFAPPQLPPPPRLLDLSLSRARFRAREAGARAGGAGSGSELGYRGTEAGHTIFTVYREVRGVRREGTCRARRAHRSRLRGCTRLVRIGSFTKKALAGGNRLPFTGRLRGRALAPGEYLLRATPVSSGARGITVSVAFRILRSPAR
ncbi:MAG: hypothetical protein ACRDNJ_10380, partial [Solirubrobacteraceae bacterium]